MHIVIIGNGIAGITAARTIRKLSDHRITVISAESEYFFARTALMYVFMGHMRWQDIEPYERWFWTKNKINLILDKVINLEHHTKQITTAGGQIIPFDKLIIATGSRSSQLNVHGHNLEGVRGLYGKEDLEYLQSKSANIHKAVIVGGGLIGVELAEMLHSRGIPVTFLVREAGFSDVILPYEESRMINRHIVDQGIDLRLETELHMMEGDASGHVMKIKTTAGEDIACDFVGVTIGVHPNVAWLSHTPLEIEQGIIVDDYLQTNLKDIYAIGDCAQWRNPLPGRKPIEPFWYTGRMMGECVAQTICGDGTRYDPGIWFNSAKFFDIEYQVYGDIRTVLTAEQQSFFWQHPDQQKSIRINYTQERVVGFNLLGIRFRQEVCEKWINNHTPLEQVLQQLELAHFDAEFSKTYSHQVRALYASMHGREINPVGKMSYNAVYSFLKKKYNPVA